MNTVFADSFFYLALLNPRDSGHALAKETSRDFTGRDNAVGPDGGC
jgi:hypothetical protein